MNCEFRGVLKYKTLKSYIFSNYIKMREEDLIDMVNILLS